MKKIIETTAEAMWISARKEERDAQGNVVGVSNAGQSCIALVPAWANWGRTLQDGTKLEGGRFYKITIEVEE